MTPSWNPWFVGGVHLLWFVDCEFLSDYLLPRASGGSMSLRLTGEPSRIFFVFSALGGVCLLWGRWFGVVSCWVGLVCFVLVLPCLMFGHLGLPFLWLLIFWGWAFVLGLCGFRSLWVVSHCWGSPLRLYGSEETFCSFGNPRIVLASKKALSLTSGMTSWRKDEKASLKPQIKAGQWSKSGFDLLQEQTFLKILAEFNAPQHESAGRLKGLRRQLSWLGL